MLIQDWYNIDREEALELVKQMALDQADLEAANPAMAGGPRIPEPEPKDEGPGGEEQDKPPGKPEA